MPTEPQSQPLVSIIVPVYNAADHIARCIESIRRQTYRNLEIILLNDGSKDVSYAVCQSYAGIDRRIVVIDKNNSGVSATRNLGMQEAHGKYFQPALCHRAAGTESGSQPRRYGDCPLQPH